MSNPLYNPYASGNQSSSQGQYGRNSFQAGRDPRRVSPRLGPGTSFSASGTSSASSASSAGMIAPLLGQSVSYRPEPSRTLIDEDIERSVDMHISRAREEVRFLGKPVHQPTGPGTHFTSAQRSEFPSSDTGMSSYAMSSTSASGGQRHPDVEGGSTSLDWLPSYKRSTADDSSKFYSSDSSNFLGGADSRFSVSGEREHDMQSIPGLGDYEYPVQDKPEASTKSSRPKYTSESAANILLHFGLEKEDLEHLISYPEDQITPANLPFILRQIRIQKAKRATSAVQSKPYPEPQPTRSVTERDMLNSSAGAVLSQEEISSAVLKPSKVIDYGHTGKYSVVDDIGRSSGSRMLVNTYSSDSHSQKPPQKMNPTEVKSSALGSSRVQGSSLTNSSYSSKLSSVASPSNDPAERMQSQPNQTSRSILSSLSLPKKDTDIRPFKSEASKVLPLKEPTENPQSASKTTPSNPMHHGVHPARPGLVLIGRNNTSGSENQSKTKGKGSVVAEQMNKQTQPPKKQETPHVQKQQQQQQQAQKQPVPLMGQAIWPPVFSAQQQIPPASIIPSNSDPFHSLQHSLFVPGRPLVPPVSPQPAQNLMNFIQMVTPQQKQPQRAICKGLPTAAMMHDYAAASPRVFPHTCSLCYKECTHMKDWISHQNTSLHLQSCKILRAQYPEWNGEIKLEPSATGNDAKPSSSTSAKTSQHRHQKIRHGSRSRSQSPRRPRDHERRGKRSRSRSPQGSRYSRSSRSRSRSPRHEGPSSSRPRRYERRPSPRRRDEKRPSPRRTEGWQSSQRSRERGSPRRVDERRSPPRRSRERQTSSERSPPQQKRPNNAETLAKKLLEKPAVQSLSKESDLETVVKTLAPAFLAELAKMKSSSPSSSSLPKVGKRPLVSPPAGKGSFAFAVEDKDGAKKETKTAAVKSKPSQQKASVSTRPKVCKAPTFVKLEGIRTSLSHNDVVTAVEQFGKTKSVILYRSKLEAVVCFEKEEDAKKLKSLKSLVMNGMPVNVASERDAVSKEQTAPEKKLQISNVSKSKDNKSTTIIDPTKVNCPTKPLSLSPKAKKVPTGKLANKKSAAKAKGSASLTKAKGLVSKMKNVKNLQKAKTIKSVQQQKSQITKISTPQKPTTSEDSLTAVGALTEEKMEETAAKDTNVPVKSEDCPDVETLKSVVTMEAKVVETGSAAVSELNCHEKPFTADVEMKEAKDAEPMELGETAVEVAEPMEAENCAEEKRTNTEVVPEKSSEVQPPTCSDETKQDTSPPEPSAVPSQSTEAVPKPSDIQAQSPQTTIGTQEVSSQVQQSSAIEPEPLVQELETKTRTSQIQEQSASASTEGASEAPLTVEKVETKMEHKDPAFTAKTHGDPSSAQDVSKAVSNISTVSTDSGTSAKTEPTAEAVTKRQPGPTSPSSAAATHVTIGEMMEKHLAQYKLPCFKMKNCFFAKKKVLVINNLPKYKFVSYTEEDLAKLLIPFGFEYKAENIYVIPQICMAFAMMPTIENMRELMKSVRRRHLSLKMSKLMVQVVSKDMAMTPLGFYKSLMRQMNSPVLDDGGSIIYIKNISPSEAKELRESLNKIGSVRNFMPLLNKVFVEFESNRDADRLGVWYSLLKQAPAHKVCRLKVPHSGCKALPPRLAANAIPDVAAGPTIPATKFGVPRGSVSPFWVTLASSPFLFPTMSPWFIIPDTLTVRVNEDITRVNRHGTIFPTVMFTGLPEGNYKHEDFAKLVWPYFPKQTLHSLYYNIIVLTLQRRAFVYFSDWTSCSNFVRDHIKNPVSVRGSLLNVHFVLEHMAPEPSEELMYKTLMKWSNAVSRLSVISK
uniref:Matrin-type domain-containing protein n=1 Tax=Echeneis naucrates TaxID=173247 RepID=A0A665TPZ5_ECHNA